MANRATTAVSASSSAHAQTTLPYRPSWLDQLMAAVEKLPAPYWLTYLLLGVFETMLLQLITWLAEPETRFVLQLESAIFPVWTWGVLALITALNHEAIFALHRFRPLLDAEDSDIGRLEYEFTTMPARVVLIFSPLWIAVFALIAFIGPSFEQHRANHVLFAALLVAGLAAFLIGSGIYIHTVHQLRLVNRLYSRMKKINLFHLIPVYAFSGLTAQTAIGFVVLIAVTQLLYPYSWADPNVIALYLGQLLLALAVFILPLRHAHLRLVSGKQRLQAEAAQRMETKLHRMHQAMDEENIAALESLNKVMSALASEQDMLAKIPTWPWQSGTLRTVTTVLLVPIALFLIQAVLRRWLGI